jgi:phosphatidylglycerol---prolipoprotein diacylglyceryl transferase
MDPILFVLDLGSVARPIGSYGLMLSIAILVGSAITVRAAVRAGMEVGSVIAALGVMTAAAGAGALSLNALIELLRTGSIEGAIRYPGLVFFGAPIGGGIAMYFATRWLGLPLGRLVDVAIAGLPAAHAIGRIGCFLGGCCYGLPWNGVFAVAAHSEHSNTDLFTPRHPVQLYEAAGLLVLAFGLTLWPLRRVGYGARGFVYLMSYGALRIMTEALRGDTVRGVWLGGISTSQFVGAFAVIAGVVGFVIASRLARRAQEGSNERVA